MNDFEYNTIISTSDIVDECNIREQHVLECDYMSTKMKLGYILALKDILSYCHFLELASEKEVDDLPITPEEFPKYSPGYSLSESKVGYILNILKNSRKTP